MSDSLKHIALIMDGNGRWALTRNHPRVFGHIQGMKSSLKIIEHCSQIKLSYLSLFALSTENLKRSSSEVENLKKLLNKAFQKYSALLFKHKIRFHIIGDLSVFSENLQEQCKKLQQQTRSHQGLNLIIALNYGGRQEIVKAFQTGLNSYLKSNKDPEFFDEKQINSFFPSSSFPPPDLIIRTGGQTRLSNFYLWSAAYSELYFSKTPWPDFKPQNLEQAIEEFHKRKRHYGRT